MNDSTARRVRSGEAVPAISQRAGNRLRACTSVLLALLPLAVQAGSVDYRYDALGRLAKAIYSNGTTTTTISYSYDAVGNRTSVATTSP